MSDANMLFLCKTSDLSPGLVMQVERPEGALAVYNLDGKFYAEQEPEQFDAKTTWRFFRHLRQVSRHSGHRVSGEPESSDFS